MTTPKIYNNILKQIIYLLAYQDILFLVFKVHFFTIIYSNYYIASTLYSLLFVYIFFFLIKIHKLHLENQTYQNINHNLLTKYHKLSNELDNYRLFKHNLYANLLSLKYQKDKFAEALDELIIKYHEKPVFNPTSNILEDFIYNHILSYQNLNSKIEINLDSKLIQKLDSKKYLNFFETLSILINNACEAAIKTSKKIIYIEVNKEEDYLKVFVTNTFNNQIDLESFGLLNYSTKNRNSGLGIYSILKNNHNLYFKIIDDVFICEYKMLIK